MFAPVELMFVRYDWWLEGESMTVALSRGQYSLSMGKLRNRIWSTALAVLMVGAIAAHGQVDVQSNEWSRLARQVFGELIALDTTHESGDTTPAAELLAHRLREAGFNSEDVEVVGPGRSNKNLVARLRGSGRGRPILFFAHLDVVAAPRDQWNTDPFTLTERDGNFYGRGAFDVKNEDADMVVNLIRLKREGYRPAKDIIIALTAGEESGADYNGVTWLLQNRKSLIDAEYSINLDIGDAHNRRGQHAIFGYNLDEKAHIVWILSAKGQGGHSDQPSPDNAIARLAAAVVRIHDLEFPVHLTNSTRAYLRRMAAIESDPLASDMRALADSSNDPDVSAVARRVATGSPEYNAQFRTTCVPTIIKGGFAVNALPTDAEASISCRILPDDSYDFIGQTLKRTIADEQIQVRMRKDGPEVAVVSELEPRPEPQSPAPELEAALQQIVGQMWPKVPVVPVLQIGASDSLPLRLAGVPSYGVQGMYFDIEDANQQHGPNERVGVREFYEGVEFTNRLMRILTRDSTTASHLP